MKKETIIALVEKDLRELQVITTGLFELQQPAPSIVKLAQDKANEIAKNMELLLSIPEQFDVKKKSKCLKKIQQNKEKSFFLMKKLKRCCNLI